MAESRLEGHHAVTSFEHEIVKKVDFAELFLILRTMKARKHSFLSARYLLETIEVQITQGTVRSKTKPHMNTVCSLKLLRFTCN